VQEIERALDPVSHTVTVRIALPRTAGLRSGMFGRARIPGAAARSVVVPDAALVRHGQLTFVFVNDGGVARLRMVRVAPDAAGRSVVASGLSAGETIVVDPPQGLQDGQAIAAKGAR
jgi:multidrug efflux pump subunit AcrA (membrane-fusion protein)